MAMNFDNYDLFRATSLNPNSVASALLWLRGEDIQPPFPTSIHFDLTLRCTAHCVHCKQWTWPPHNELGMSELEQLFEIFKSWGIQTITLGGGNPLLHEHIIRVLELAHSAGIEVGIISEGLDLSTELAEAICQYARWIRFSLDGPTSQVHDTIRNTPGLFEKVVNAIQQLRSHDDSIEIGINCVFQKLNAATMPDMLDLADSLYVNVLLYKLPHGNDPGHHYIPSRIQWSEFVKWVLQAAPNCNSRIRTNLPQLASLLRKVYTDKDVLDGYPVKTFYSQNHILCYVPFFFLTCASDGTIFPCDYLHADTRIWGQRYYAMRREFQLGNIIKNPDVVRTTLSSLFRARIHFLPANGYPECGCCTRFAQLNARLSDFDLETSNEQLKALLDSPSDNTVFL